MFRKLLQVVVVAMLTVILFRGFAQAADAERSQSFKITITSSIVNEFFEMKGQNKRKIDAETVLEYTWKGSGRERTLNFDSVLLKTTVDGNQAMNGLFMSRAKLITTHAGKTSEAAFEDGPEQLRKCFAIPSPPQCASFLWTRMARRPNAKSLPVPGRRTSWIGA